MDSSVDANGVLGKVGVKRGLEQVSEAEKYQKVTISNELPTAEHKVVMENLRHSIALRDKWINYLHSEPCVRATDAEASSPKYDVFDQSVPTKQLPLSCQMIDGVGTVSGGGDDKQFTIPSFSEFVGDYLKVRSIVHSGAVKSYCYKRLALLEARFSIHALLNADKELQEQKDVPFRDITTCRKVDTHVHHSGCMTQKHLLHFIRKKLKEHPEDVVAVRNGAPVTLAEAFAGMNLTAEALSIDTLDMHAHDTYQRFDRFNQKFNPAGEGLLREIFLKTDNALTGRYLAEITKEVMAQLESSKYTTVEWRISIYGRKPTEWRALAAWFYEHRLAHKNVRWMIQVPRIYHVYRGANQIASFGEMLRNIFEPIFENTINPASDPALFYFLQAIVGFDSVDDESVPESESLSATLPTPEAYTSAHNPPYAYWMYYMYANLRVLNVLRHQHGLHAFTFRPHAGEAGDPDHLVSTFLVADGINHGLNLRRSPVLHYLHYLTQIGVAMSPLCNSKLFVSCHKNPFRVYQRQGLNVSLSTDAPLLTHHTEDALAEEYTVCAQLYKLSATDLCEIARNSVLQSGLEEAFKKHFLGADYNDPVRMNVPSIRLSYRAEVMQSELAPLAM